jgi:hypothetical protein
LVEKEQEFKCEEVEEDVIAAIESPPIYDQLPCEEGLEERFKTSPSFSFK